ncbi:MAG: M28 family peptidase [Bacteroidales bacterium]|nr:M28 family peptidase [Bacteroidales bacterium]
MKHVRIIPILTLVLLMGGIISSVCAQDTNYARRIIRELSSPGMYGRGASYSGDSIAAKYLRREFRRLGVKPLGVDYYQRYTYNTFSMEGQCWISINGKRLKNYHEFRVAPWSASVTLPEADIVYLPFETFCDNDKLQKFISKRKKALADCFIYIEIPRLIKMSPTTSAELAKLKKRNPFGSRGIIIGRSALNTYSLSQCESEHSYAYIEVLSSVMPKKIKQSSICINTQFRPNYKTQNVCGLIPGEVDTMIVLTAHYDHLGTMGDGYKYMEGAEIKHEGDITFFGAHDNASGVAAVLDLARLASKEKPHYTLVFMFFSGEEAGLKGSTYAAQHPLVDFNKVKFLLNIDLFCGGNEGLMMFNAQSNETKPYFERLKTLNDALQVAPELRPRTNSPNSDHYPFSSLCPSMYILTMGHPYGGYHDPADRCEACGLENYTNYLTLISSLLIP